MIDFFCNNTDYLILVHGFLFLIMAVSSFSLAKDANFYKHWCLLSFSSAFMAISIWFDGINYFLSPTKFLFWSSTFCLWLSYFLFFEFIRQSIKNFSEKNISFFFHIPITLIAISGLFFNDQTFIRTTLSYTMFPASTLLAVLMSIYRSKKINFSSQNIHMTSSLLFIYAIITTIFNIKTSYPPTNILNKELFQSIFLIPLELIQVALMTCMTITIKWHYRDILKYDLKLASNKWNNVNIVNIILITTVLVIGLFATIKQGEKKEFIQSKNFLDRIKIVAATFDPYEIRNFKKNKEDLKNPIYAKLQEKVNKIAASNEDLNLVYLYYYDSQDNKTHNLVHSTPKNSSENLLPGDVFFDLVPEEAITFFQGIPSRTKPYSDKWGTWITGLAPVVFKDSSQRSVDIALGVDIEASQWQQMIKIERAWIMGIVLTIAIFILLIMVLAERDLITALLFAKKEKIIRQVLDATTQGHWMRNLKTNEGVISDNIFTALGYRPELIKNHLSFWKSLIFPDDISGIKQMTKAHLNQKTPYFEAVYRVKDSQGKYKLIHDKGRIVEYNGQNNPVLMVGSFVDITQKKENEEAALKRELKIRQYEKALFEIIKLPPQKPENFSTFLKHTTALSSKTLEVERVGIWLYKKEGAILECIDLFINSSGEHKQGDILKEEDFELEFIYLKQNSYVDAHDPYLDPRTQGYIESYLKPNNITSLLDVSIKISGKNIGLICFEHVNKVHRWNDDEIHFASQIADQLAIAIINNEKVIAQKDRENMQSQLIHSAKLASIGTLAAGVAHEINNPLAIIRGNTELIHKFLTPQENLTKKEQILDLLNRQTASVDRIANIVQGLRSYAHADGNTLEPFDLNQSVLEVLNLFGPIITKKGISIAKNLTSERIFIIGSSGKLQQVLTNLITNAQDALEKTANPIIEISTSIENRKALIICKDNGHGITNEILSHLFDPFFTTKAPGKGTGLGLAISKNLIEEMHGTIEVKSEVEKGTSFIISIPIYLG